MTETVAIWLAIALPSIAVIAIPVLLVGRRRRERQMPTPGPTPSPSPQAAPQPPTADEVAPDTGLAEPESGAATPGLAEPETGVAEPESAAPVLVETPEPAAGRLVRLRARLARSGSPLGTRLLAVLSRDQLTEDDWD